jgi:hypothetical protein
MFGQTYSLNSGIKIAILTFIAVIFDLVLLILFVKDIILISLNKLKDKYQKKLWKEVDIN